MFLKVIGVMNFLNEVGTRGVLDSLTLNSSITEDLALSVGFTAITVWEKKEAVDMQWLAMHPRRPRGSQSGREKRWDERCQVRAKEHLGTDSHRTISKNSSGCRLWLGTKNALYYCAQSANSLSWALFVSCTRRLLSRSRILWFMHRRNARSQETFSFI